MKQETFKRLVLDLEVIFEPDDEYVKGLIFKEDVDHCLALKGTTAIITDIDALGKLDLIKSFDTIFNTTYFEITFNVNDTIEVSSYVPGRCLEIC